MSIPPPLSPAELLRSVGLVAFRAGEGRELLYNEHTGAARLLTYEDGDLLSSHTVFRSAADQALALCSGTGIPASQAPAIRSQISLLARAGLLVRRSEILERLAAKSALPADPLHAVPAGMPINEALRAFPGKRLLLGAGELRGSPGAGCALVSEGDPVLEERREAWHPYPGTLHDTHARVLGAAPGDVVTPDVDLDLLDARFLRRLRLGDGRIAVSQHGVVAPDGFARGVDRLLVCNRAFTLEGPLGLDNRLLLPPAPDIPEGAREVFLLAVRKVHDRALFALLPGVVEGSKPAPPARTRIADYFLVLLAPLEIGSARPDGAPRLKAVAAHLRSVASLPPVEFRALLRPLLWQRASMLLPEDRLGEMLDPDFDRIAGIEDPRGAILAYAKLLEGWGP